MIVLLCLILSIGGLVFYCKKAHWADAELATMFSPLFVLASVALGFGIGLEYFDKVETKRIRTTKQIYSLRTHDQTYSNFSLGSGRISSVEHYFAFCKDERGAYYRYTVPTHHAFVLQDEDKNPYVTWETRTTRLSRWVSFWPTFEKSEDLKADLHVPKDTIIEEFKLQ